jgi:Ser/Thr protein kinase RdoA (MazF antagonist)
VPSDQNLDWISELVPGCEPIDRLAGYHNDIWRVRYHGSVCVLRVSPPGHRTESELHAEIEFLRYLSEAGAPVVRPLPFSDGRFVWRVGDPNVRYACLFEFIHGSGWRDAHHGDDVIVAAGDALGRIHAASREFAPSGNRRRRLWHEKAHLVRAPEVAERIKPGLGSRIVDFLDQLQTLDHREGGWGLTHGDYLFSNYLVVDDGVCVIDFDDCEYGYYASDLAVNVYYYVLGGEPRDADSRTDRAAELLGQLLQGYRRHQSFSRADAELADLLLVQREIDLLSSIAQHFDLASPGPWQEAFVETSVPRILEHRPVVSLAAVYR